VLQVRGEPLRRRRGNERTTSQLAQDFGDLHGRHGEVASRVSVQAQRSFVIGRVACRPGRRSRGAIPQRARVGLVVVLVRADAADALG
jgi:hypothetical protein